MWRTFRQTKYISQTRIRISKKFFLTMIELGTSKTICSRTHANIVQYQYWKCYQKKFACLIIALYPVIYRHRELNRSIFIIDWHTQFPFCSMVRPLGEFKKTSSAVCECFAVWLPNVQVQPNSCGFQFSCGHESHLILKNLLFIQTKPSLFLFITL